jgi:repressor of nif and glnA expression
LDILSEQSNGELEVCASRVATATYCSEIQSLIQLSSGFYFRESTACLAQLENFSILQMVKKIMEVAPSLWHLLGVLLDADTSRR